MVRRGNETGEKKIQEKILHSGISVDVKIDTQYISRNIYLQDWRYSFSNARRFLPLSQNHENKFHSCRRISKQHERKCVTDCTCHLSVTEAILQNINLFTFLQNILQLHISTLAACNHIEYTGISPFTKHNVCPHTALRETPVLPWQMSISFERLAFE